MTHIYMSLYQHFDRFAVIDIAFTLVQSKQLRWRKSELNCSNRKILYGTVYRPNNRTRTDDFLNILEDISTQYTYIIISWDFNSNVLSDNWYRFNIVNLFFTTSNEKNPSLWPIIGSCFLETWVVFLILCDIRNFDMTVLSYEINTIDWKQIYYIESVEYHDFSLNYSINYLYEKCVPLKRKECHQNNNLGLTMK